MKGHDYLDFAPTSKDLVMYRSNAEYYNVKDAAIRLCALNNLIIKRDVSNSHAACTETLTNDDCSKHFALLQIASIIHCNKSVN